MMGDGTPVMETIGQIPGSCEELFGWPGNGTSELVGASREWLGRRHELFFFPDVSLEKTRTESCDGSTRKSGSHVLGGRRQGGGHLRPFVTGSPAPSGYGEDGVYSREAADKK